MSYSDSMQCLWFPPKHYQKRVRSGSDEYISDIDGREIEKTSLMCKNIGLVFWKYYCSVRLNSYSESVAQNVIFVH